MIKQQYRITDYRVNQHTGMLQVKIADNEGKPIGTDKGLREFTSAEKDQLNLKVLKLNANTVPSVKIGSSQIGLIGSPQNRVISTEDYGNFITGQTTFTAHPSEIRLYGIYRLNSHLTSTMPSTIITPVPVLQLDLPTAALAKTLTKVIDDYKSMLSGLIS